MNIENLEKELMLLRQELNSCYGSSYLSYYEFQYAKAANLIEHCAKKLQNHQTFLKEIWNNNIKIENAKKMIDYLIELVKNEKKILNRKTEKPEAESHSIFKTASDKIESASLAFKQEDWDGVMNNLNTALELALKDKLDIPTTISNINTNKIIEILVSHKLGPAEHLKEVKKYVRLANVAKHMGYENQKVDCVKAIKGVQELLPRLEKLEIKMSEEVKDKIYGAV